MSKNVLVLGGSYFAGRVFSILASRDGNWELSVMNRGRFPLNLPHVTEYKCDRHETEKALSMLPDTEFDAVVDFCAYGPGDIEPLVDGLGKRAGQYIFLSTCSVYDPTWSNVKDEDSPTLKYYKDASCCGTTQADTPVLEEFGANPISDYIRGKVMLETELIRSCRAAELPYTIIRPAFIYGPFNYALRESFFIERIVKNIPVPVPSDSTACFSLIYVADLARALMCCAGDERAYDQIFNISAPEKIDYARFLDSLEKANGAPFDKEEMTVERVLEDKIALPFPLIGDELYDGGKLSSTFDFSYTPLDRGMDKTFQSFKSVYAE